jgi:large subunit ribosomal protein L22
MPVATAKLRYLRIAPRKVRLVADLIRGKSVTRAQEILNFTTKRASPVLLKLLKSAIANAKNQIQTEEVNLYISKIAVDEGPKLKRWMPRARGQAYEIQKKTSHITLVLDTIKPIQLKEAKKTEKAKEEVSEKRQSELKKQKIKPKLEEQKPKVEKGMKRMFRRKSF